jgi:hypothetical protein
MSRKNSIRLALLTAGILVLGAPILAHDTEPNNDIDSAVPIGCPTSFSGFITPEGDVDFYSFTGQPGMLFRAEITANRTGSDLDGILGLYDPARVLLATADDELGLDPALEYVIQTSGTYYLAVASSADFDFNGGEDSTTTGEYDLAVTCDIDPNEPNDDLSSAAAFPCGTTTLGVPPTILIGPAEDVDYYSFSVPAGTAWTGEVFAWRFHRSDLDPVLGLYDSSWTLVMTNDNRFVFDPFLSTLFTEAGTYYLAVASYSDFDFNGGSDSLTQGRYDMTMNCAQTGEGNLGFEDGSFNHFIPYGEASVISTVEPLVPPEGTYMAMISSGGTALNADSSMLERTFLLPEDALCINYQYNFLTNEDTPDEIFNDRLALQVHRADRSEEQTVADTFADFVPGPEGWTWQTGWQAASVLLTQRDEHVSLRWVVEDVPDSQTDSAGLIDDLVVASDDLNEPNDNLVGATPRSFPFLQQCVELEPLADVDYYSFPASSGDVVTAEIMGSRIGSSLDARLGLFDSVGTLLAETDDDLDLDPILTVTIGATGTYTVAVASWGDVGYDGGPDANDTGIYTLKVSLSSPAPERRRLFALDNDSGGTIHELDPDTGAILNSFPTPEAVAAGADGLAYDEETNELFVINGTGSRIIYRLNATSGQQLGSFPAPTVEAIDGLGFDDDTLYAQVFARDEVLTIHPQTGGMIDSRLTSPRVDLAGGFAGGVGRLFGTETFTAVDEIEQGSLGILNSFSTPSSASAFGLGFDGTDLFASFTSPDQISAMDPDTGAERRAFADPTPGSIMSALAAGPAPTGPDSPPPPGEVAELLLEDDGSTTTLSWTDTDRALVYNVYRGFLSDLPSQDYGGCLAPGLSKTTHSYQDLESPSVGQGFTYLVTAANTGGEGSLGTGNGEERSHSGLNPACP